MTWFWMAAALAFGATPRWRQQLRGEALRCLQVIQDAWLGTKIPLEQLELQP